MGKFATLARNTFIETIRQPVYAIIIGVAVLLFIISPAVTMYTMSDDEKLLREVGLSTLFLTSLFISIFSASGSVAEEIENKTIMTVLTKPVSRPLFVSAKFFGVAGAVALSHYICTIALLMSIRHGVLETASESVDWTVIGAGALTVGLTFVLSTFFNYAYDWKFSSTAVLLGALFATSSISVLCFMDRSWQFNPGENGINTLDIYGSVLLFLAAVIIAVLAIALSTRFNIIVTLGVCVGIFLLGLVSDYVFGRLADTYLWAKICYFIVPNLQIFWISDAIYEGSEVSAGYLFAAAFYAVCYAGAILLLAIALFQRRQVG